MINENQDDNVVIDMMNPPQAPNPLDEFEDEDDNDFLNEAEPEEETGNFMEEPVNKQTPQVEDDFKIGDEGDSAVNNDSVIDASREKILFEKLGMACEFKIFCNLLDETSHFLKILCVRRI